MYTGLSFLIIIESSLKRDDLIRRIEQHYDCIFDDTDAFQREGAEAFTMGLRLFIECFSYENSGQSLFAFEGSNSRVFFSSPHYDDTQTMDYTDISVAVASELNIANIGGQSWRVPTNRDLLHLSALARQYEVAFETGTIYPLEKFLKEAEEALLAGKISTQRETPE